MNEAYIEKAATDLLKQIYRDCRYLWPDQAIQPMMMRIFASLRWFVAMISTSIPLLGRVGSTVTTRGLLLLAWLIVSRTRSPLLPSDKVELFPRDHEIGHLVLHEDTVLHRDRASDGSPLLARRPPAEREADRFTDCSLMPQKLVKERFEFMVRGIGQLRFSDMVAFHLNPINPSRLL
ncbi:ImmA/IrrE family metallo-endopeptidase [Pseudomonas aeruginosa]|uniref:ImmA/IrrE family metallo-endopeptidase n=1 Tax=Pseudomonas aeruginosa TaxID=287 RepID=UPI000442E73E|nr:methenyltetrahydrofolate cyclohydrolase [Pseudomonas aeruginosa]AHW70878.1 hypothetical protein PA96_2392 [Pseudomonas aeruginosa PA96]MCM3969555.1 methenyltetrahydrofolate cyclohydrolase [Pseudomonas aeruginosa]MCM4035719.1 methenyltetrahydrofolate cyclohydrolase [Pseudomonas aeruginosa]MCM4053418.1 methenyltetrahydrofolate cyclohydrolase [Pseudomonas aeruginosa]MCU9381902.1 methenyltetrahydrofolate cyclohydrolase [Pseudomonas aeruginosa]